MCPKRFVIILAIRVLTIYFAAFRHAVQRVCLLIAFADTALLSKHTRPVQKSISVEVYSHFSLRCPILCYSFLSVQMASRYPPMDRSHFVPYQIVNALDSQRRGAPYSNASDRAFEKCLDSDYNISVTTAHWNRGLNKRHENQLTKYATGDLEWKELTPGAKNRYFQQGEAWKDTKASTNIQDLQPALAKKLDQFYNPGNKH